MDKFRLWVATIFIWVGYRIGPKMMRPVFETYLHLLEGIPEELKSGRTYGVVMTPWAMKPEYREKADQLLNIAMTAVAAERKQEEIMTAYVDAANRGAGVKTPLHEDVQTIRDMASMDRKDRAKLFDEQTTRETKDEDSKAGS